MQLQQFHDIQEFWQVVQPYLLQAEAEHNVLLAILQTLLQYPERYPEPPYLALVHENETILAIAVRTPPNKLLLSKAQDLKALTLIGQSLQHEQLPGVSGLVAETAAFVQQWQALTGQSYQQKLDLRIYQLTQVEPVAAVNGYLRPATQADRPLLLQWFAEFNSEIDLVTDGEVERIVALRLKSQSIYLWIDEVPVSMIGGRSFSSTSARIAPVYTPPESRCRGYATAGVAALSQQFLNQGYGRCFLFTDLANPTSNSIYQKIGYRPVCDWHEYW